MKTLLRVLSFSLFVLLFLSSSSIASAVSSPSSTKTQAIILAEVNIRNAKIISQKNNVFNLSFSLSNLEGLQTGVKYGVKLVSESKTGKLTVDEKVYDESLTLNPNTTVSKEIIYTAPSILNGSYNLILISNNFSGLPFGSVNLGKVTLTATTKGVTILPETCKLQIIGDKTSKTYSLTQNIDINSGESISLTCEAMNSSKSEITTIPSYEVRPGTSFGDIITQGGGSVNPIIFKIGEKKSFFVTLPKASIPQLYNVKFTLNDKDNKSNSINVNYTILGIHATVDNVSLDKDYYNKGDKALLSLVYNSNSPSTITSKIQISDNKGKSCAKTQTQNLTNPIAPKVDTVVAITKSCINPKISIILMDDKGVVLVQKEFNVRTTSTVLPEASNSSIIWIIIILVIILIIYIYMKKKKNLPSNIGESSTSTKSNNNISINIIFPFLILALFGFMPIDKALASTVSVGQGKYAVVDIDKSTYYYPGDNVNGSAFIGDTGQEAPGKVEISIPDASAEQSRLYTRSKDGTLTPPRSYVGLPIPSTAGTHNATFYISAFINTTLGTTRNDYKACLSDCNLTPTYNYYYELNGDGTYSPWYTGGPTSVKYKFIKTLVTTPDTDNYLTGVFSIPFTVVVPPKPTIIVWKGSLGSIPFNTPDTIFWKSINTTNCTSCSYTSSSTQSGDCTSSVIGKISGSFITPNLKNDTVFKISCSDILPSLPTTPGTEYWFRLHSCQDATDYEAGPYLDYQYSTGDLLAGALDNGTYNYRVVGSATSSYGFNNIGVSKASIITCPL